MTDIYISHKGDSGILAPRMLMMYNGQNETLRYDEKGKPYFTSAYVSISHSGSLWACALSDAPCGVDIQRKQNVRFDKLAARYFTDSEAARVLAEGQDAFFEIWTAKEAYAKLTGEGLAKTYRVSPFDAGVCITYFDAGKDYTGCAVSHSHNGNIRVFAVD